MEKLVLPVVLTAGGVDLVHSLFSVGTSQCIEEDGELWGVLGESQACNSPNIVKLTPALFASNTPFFGTNLEDFEAHVTGLSSVLPKDFDTTAHQPVLENDEDARKICSRGTTILPLSIASKMLDMGPSVSIADVVCHFTPPSPSRPVTPHHLKVRWTGSRQASPPKKGETTSNALSAHTKTL